MLVHVIGSVILATGAAAQQAPLGEIDLPAGPLVVDLSDAVVRIVSTDDTDPVMRWRPVRPGAPGSAEVAAFQDGAAIVIARPRLAEGEIPARIRLDITAAAGFSLAIRGEDIDLELDNAIPERPEVLETEPPTTPPIPPPPIELGLVSSEISMTGVGPTTGALEASVAEISGSNGNHDLTVHHSRVRVVEHIGAVTIAGDGADVIIEDTNGPVSVKSRGGSLDLRSTRGRLKIELNDADLQILESIASGLIALTETNGDIRDARFQSINLKTEMSHVATSGCTGDHTIDVAGGSLTADLGSGAITGTARDGAQIDLTDHRGNITLNLQPDASADLRSIDGDANLTSHQAEVAVDGVKSLTIVLNDSYATLNGVEKLASFQATRSEVELDLSTCRDRKLEIAARADSMVRVQIKVPCRVRAQGVSSSLASQVDVSGCELQLGQGRWATKTVRGIDGQLPIMLVAQVADTAELVVDGRP